MPKKRQPKEVWRVTRARIWKRDNGQCQSPLKSVAEGGLCIGKPSVSLETCNIDHIRSGMLGTNEDSNLRTLCKVCHGLRRDARHSAMRDKMIARGELPPNWRGLTWDESDYLADKVRK